MSSIALQRVSKVFPNGVRAVWDLSLEVSEGECVCVVGPSGCGKTTLLRLVAGLEPISEGAIFLKGQPAAGCPPHTRNIAMVFQEPALLPHLTAAGNIGFGLKLRGLSPQHISACVHDMAAQLGITSLLPRRPDTLSGGEQQRVALARALVRRPSVLLLDEPLSSLDTPTRLQLRMEIRNLQRCHSITLLHVTHDQGEAMSMGDRVAVMNAGHLEQVAPPMELLEKPANTSVARFIGTPPMNLVRGRIVRGNHGSYAIRCDTGTVLELPADHSQRLGLWFDQPVILGVRPHHVRLVPADAPAQSLMLPATVRLVEPGLQGVSVHTEAAGGLIVVVVNPPVPLRDGQAVSLTINPDDIYVFDEMGCAIMFPGWNLPQSPAFAAIRPESASRDAARARSASG